MKLFTSGKLALALCLPLVFLLSCVGDRIPTDGLDGASLDRMPGVRIFIVSGNNQVGTPGQPLPQPVVVRVVDQRDRPVADAVVNWLVREGGGSVDPRQGRTDADGFASAVWTLGADGGEASLRASGTGGTVVFNASARPPGSTVTLEKVSGDGQAGAPGAALAEPLVVRARDGAGAPVAGVVVRWSAPVGGGTVSPAEAVTGADGLAETQWTLGTATDAQTATAIGAGSVVAFTATARQPGMGGSPVVMYIVKNPVWAAPGDSVQMRAVFLDDDGRVTAGPEVRWSLLTGSNATIDPSGLVRVRAQGPERVIAEAGAFTAWAELNPWSGKDVNGAPLPALYVLPGASRLTVGQTLRLRAVRVDADGSARTVGDATWESLSNYASVDGTGLVRGVRPGRGAISVRAGGLRTLASLDVGEATGAPAPRISSISVTPERADVSTGPATVKIAVRALDPDGAPAAGFRVEAASPTFRPYTCGPAGPPEASTECELEIPAGAEAGTYTLRTVTVWDAAGRTATYSLVALREAGVRSFFEIQNRPFDALPPTITELRIDPPVSGIFVGRLASRVYATLRDASGVRSGLLRARSPSGGQSAECRLVPTSGNTVESAWSCDMAFPVNPEQGAWRVSMELVDRVGNRAKLGESDLRARGINPEFRVAGRAQPSGLLAAFAMEPSRGKVGQRIYASVQVTDGAGQGHYVNIALRAPDGYERYCTSQTSPDGSWRCPTVPQPGQDGTWTVVAIGIRTYDWSVQQVWDTAELKKLGYTTEFQVDP